MSVDLRIIGKRPVAAHDGLLRCSGQKRGVRRYAHGRTALGCILILGLVPIMLAAIAVDGWSHAGFNDAESYHLNLLHTVFRLEFMTYRYNPAIDMKHSVVQYLPDLSAFFQELSCAEH